MTWKELKEWCAKHQITLGFKSIRFSQIPETKQYFERRPKWDVFEFSGDSYKQDEEYLKIFEKYVWRNRNHTVVRAPSFYYNTVVRAPIFYYKPADLSNISNYDVDLFLEKGKIPPKFFQKWSSEPVPIYTVDDLEKAYTELLTHLKVCKSLQNSQDLRNWTDQYKKKLADIERINSEINDIKKKYKQSFCKQANIAKDF